MGKAGVNHPAFWHLIDQKAILCVMYVIKKLRCFHFIVIIFRTSKMDCSMKSCATPSISLALLSFANVWQGFLVSGLYGVVVSTLEKR